MLFGGNLFELHLLERFFVTNDEICRRRVSTMACRWLSSPECFAARVNDDDDDDDDDYGKQDCISSSACCPLSFIIVVIIMAQQATAPVRQSLYIYVVTAHPFSMPSSQSYTDHQNRSSNKIR